jgi:putative Mn2+ efflux pump MntP
MAFFEIIFIAIGLSTDAFSVALGNGMSLPVDGAKSGERHDTKRTLVFRALAVAAAFGGFQALMPLVGYFAGRTFTGYIEAYDHVVALALLAFIGGRMIGEGRGAMRRDAAGTAQGGGKGKNFSAGALLMQAVATSIDALIVGVGFAAVGLSPSGLAGAVTLIGVITFALSFAGVWAGKRFGALLGSRAEIAGGLILIAIGIKIFVGDMFF